MNKKSITVTIDGIPEDTLKQFWEYARREAKVECGVRIKPADNVRINFSELADYEKLDAVQDAIAVLAIIVVIKELQKHNVTILKS